MFGDERREPRAQPQVDEVGCRGNVNLVAALQVEHGCGRVEFFERRAQVRERSGQFGRRLESRTTAHQQVDSEVILEHFYALTDGCRRHPQYFGSGLQRSHAQRQLERLKRPKIGNGHGSMIKPSFSVGKNI